VSQRSRSLLVGFGLLALFVLLAWMALIWWWKRPIADSNETMQTFFETPYRNTGPDVKYVGDDSCAGCHPDKAETYRHHPMGRSFFPASQVASLEPVDQAAHNPFERLGFQFAIDQKGESIFHTARRLGSQGQVLTEDKTAIQFVLGSGTRGRSYLLNHDGYLFQSPISWFTQKHAWDLSPGFESFYPAERVVEPACLFCHANRADWVENSRNHYRMPIFDGYAVGCERCHGPGELHALERQRGDVVSGEFDDTIVNPRRLSPGLREAVCQQCHLQGAPRFERAGRHPFDYRPGLPLHRFWAVFVALPEFRGPQRAVGQVEQMVDSRCFRASDGKLGCISCHDPHELPEPKERVGFYRSRCLSCHHEESCGLSPATRRRQNQDDSCIACHMPRLKSSDIAHTAITDHRILRRPKEPDPSGNTPQPLRPGQAPIRNFYKNELNSRDIEVARDLGVALSFLAKDPGPLREQLGPIAFPLLERVVKELPNDIVAREAFGRLLSMQGRHEEASAAFETILKQAPERELTLGFAATLADVLGRRQDAIAYLRRLVRVNPWIEEYHYRLSQNLAQGQEWQAALAECEAAVRLNPFSEQVRSLLISCCLHAGKKDQAQRELEILVRLNPKDAKVLRSWFAEQSSR
jgi:Flp pilus assembly protein TadD